MEFGGSLAAVSGLAISSAEENVIDVSISPLLKHGIKEGAGSFVVMEKEIGLAQQISHSKLWIFGKNRLQLLSRASVVAQLVEDLA